jgi:prolyl oligopeptidase
MTLSAAAAAQTGLQYPVTRTVAQVDDYHGTRVSDPYRWLEDDNSPETKAWVEAQNKVTFAYLEKIPFRAQLTERLKKLFDYAKYSAPARKGEYFFFRKNDGLQNQSVLYIQKGIDGTPEVLIDPNTWSKDGTTILTVFSPDKDAKLAVYGVSRAGSDWQEYNVLDLTSRKPLADKVEWVKVSSVAWYGNGFFYSRYPQPEKGRELSSANENHLVYYHRIGTPQAQDELVYEDKANPQRFHTLQTTDDERFAVLSISDRGTGKQGNALFVRDLTKPGAKFVPLIPEITNDSYSVLENVRGELLVYTDNNAPNGRVVRINPANPAPAHWATIIAPKTEPIDGVGVRRLTCTVWRGRSKTRSRVPVSAPRAASPATWTTSSCSTTTRRSPIPRPSSAMTSRHGAARSSARRRSPASIPTSTRRSRSSSPARTARRCRCS